MVRKVTSSMRTCDRARPASIVSGPTIGLFDFVFVFALISQACEPSISQATMQSAEFIKRVEAASRLLQACGQNRKAYEAADSSQRTALAACANNELVLDADGAAAVMQCLASSALSEQTQDHLCQVVLRCSSQPAAESRGNHMGKLQDFTGVHKCFCAAFWKAFDAEDAEDGQRLKRLCAEASWLGLKNPTEQTTRRFVALLVLARKEEVSAQEKSALVVSVKNQMRSCVLPADLKGVVMRECKDPASFRSRYDWADKALQQKPPVKCPWRDHEIAQVEISVPMRKSNKQLKGSSGAAADVASCLNFLTAFTGQAARHPADLPITYLNKAFANQAAQQGFLGANLRAGAQAPFMFPQMTPQAFQQMQGGPYMQQMHGGFMQQMQGGAMPPMQGGVMQPMHGGVPMLTYGQPPPRMDGGLPGEPQFEEELSEGGEGAGAAEEMDEDGEDGDCAEEDASESEQPEVQKKPAAQAGATSCMALALLQRALARCRPLHVIWSALPLVFSCALKHARRARICSNVEHPCLRGALAFRFCASSCASCNSTVDAQAIRGEHRRRSEARHGEGGRCGSCIWPAWSAG